MADFQYTERNPYFDSLIPMLGGKWDPAAGDGGAYVMADDPSQPFVGSIDPLQEYQTPDTIKQDIGKIRASAGQIGERARDLADPMSSTRQQQFTNLQETVGDTTQQKMQQVQQFGSQTNLDAGQSSLLGEIMKDDASETVAKFQTQYNLDLQDKITNLEKDSASLFNMAISAETGQEQIRMDREEAIASQQSAAVEGLATAAELDKEEQRVKKDEIASLENWQKNTKRYQYRDSSGRARPIFNPQTGQDASGLSFEEAFAKDEFTLPDGSTLNWVELQQYYRSTGAGEMFRPGREGSYWEAGGAGGGATGWDALTRGGSRQWGVSAGSFYDTEGQHGIKK